MSGHRGFMVLIVATAALLAAACAGAAPAPAPTAAPKPAAPAPTRAPAAPTAAPTAAPAKAAPPTAVPATAAPKVDYPTKGKTITIIVPFAAGGGNDVSARMLSPLLEKELGVPFQVANKAGAGSQTGMTELAKSKPDGYTLGQNSLPTNITAYMDPARQAAFTRKDFAPIALYASQPVVAAVRAESPIKTLKDLVDAAKAKPEGIKVSDQGLMTAAHLGVIQLERTASVKFASVHFEGGAPALTALLGEHVDAMFSLSAVALPQVKAGKIRLLATMERGRDELCPDVQTMAEQGYKVYLGSYFGMSAPAGVPAPIIDMLSGAIKKSLENQEMRKKMMDQAQTPIFMGPAQMMEVWAEQEKVVEEVMK